MHDRNLYSINSDSKASEYQDLVLNILYNHKDKKFTEDELIKLQMSIEDLTTKYDDIKSLYQLAPDLIKKFSLKINLQQRIFLRALASTSPHWLRGVSVIRPGRFD